MKYKKYWDNKQDLENWLNAVDELNKIDSIAYHSISSIAQVYKNALNIPLNEARALILYFKKGVEE